jgi:hypothetical protein
MLVAYSRPILLVKMRADIQGLCAGKLPTKLNYLNAGVIVNYHMLRVRIAHIRTCIQRYNVDSLHFVYCWSAAVFSIVLLCCCRLRFQFFGCFGVRPQSGDGESRRAVRNYAGEVKGTYLPTFTFTVFQCSKGSLKLILRSLRWSARQRYCRITPPCVQ